MVGPDRQAAASSWFGLSLGGQALLLRIAVHVNRKRTVADYPRSMDMLRRLVSIDTTSRNSNLELIDFVRNHLDRFGIASELVPDATARRPISMPPSAQRPAGICLSGHTDVVPIDGQDWSTDPWASDREGRAAVRPRHVRHEGLRRHRLTWVEAFARGDLKTPVHLLLSYDEEVGCLGVRGALEQAEAQRRSSPRASSSASRPRCASPPRTRARRACAATCMATNAIPRSQPQGRQRDRIRG
jgi:hypothetical protein